MSVMCILTLSGTKLLFSEPHGFATKNNKCKKVNTRVYTSTVEDSHKGTIYDSLALVAIKLVLFLFLFFLPIIFFCHRLFVVKVFSKYSAQHVISV